MLALKEALDSGATHAVHLSFANERDRILYVKIVGNEFEVYSFVKEKFINNPSYFGDFVEAKITPITSAK